jgi:LysR family transcriptional activator of nhaA
MKRLNYHHLYYFWRVAVAGKLTDVAESLHVSQSALSAQIKKLEQQIGTPLFTRSGRSLVLTEMGSRVLDYANAVFTKGQELERFLARGDSSATTRVSIGVLNNLSRNFVEGFIAPLFAQPAVSIALHTRNLDNLLKGLMDHEFDLALTNCAVTGQYRDTQWQQQLVARQPLAIVGPPESGPSGTFPSGYGERPWVLPSQGSEIRAAFDFFCARNDFEPTIKAEVDDMAMLRLVARDSQAFAVLPPVVVKDEVAAGTLAVYLTIPQAHEHFYAISVKRSLFPRVLDDLLKDIITA